jgi:hypothetical protein
VNVGVILIHYIPTRMSIVSRYERRVALIQGSLFVWVDNVIITIIMIIILKKWLTVLLFILH